MFAARKWFVMIINVLLALIPKMRWQISGAHLALAMTTTAVIPTHVVPKFALQDKKF
jgi:hypothetical protein